MPVLFPSAWARRITRRLRPGRACVTHSKFPLLVLPRLAGHESLSCLPLAEVRTAAGEPGKKKTSIRWCDCPRNFYQVTNQFLLCWLFHRSQRYEIVQSFVVLNQRAVLFLDRSFAPNGKFTLNGSYCMLHRPDSADLRLLHRLVLTFKGACITLAPSRLSGTAIVFIAVIVTNSRECLLSSAAGGRGRRGSPTFSSI